MNHESTQPTETDREIGSQSVETRSEIDPMEIIAELNSSDFHKLPVDAIRTIQQHPELFVPHLIQLIRDATKSVSLGEDVEQNGHFFALFLLTEFRATEGLEAIVDAVSLPDEGPFDLFDDAITETLSRILAALAAESLPTIDELIRNRSHHEFVRSAAAGSFLYLVRDGILSRDEAVERLRPHLRKAIEERDFEGVTAIVSNLVDYGPHEALAEIQQACQLDLLDSELISLEEIERAIKNGDAEFQRCLRYCRPVTGIQDTIEELRYWASFREEEDEYKQSSRDVRSNVWEETDTRRPDFEDPLLRPQETIRNNTRKVGRNDPCPCGSGRKYKKCCGTT